MDDMINRHDSIAEENIEPNGRPATNEFEEWSDEVSDRADNVFKKDKKEGPVKDREKRIKEMDEVIKKDLVFAFDLVRHFSCFNHCIYVFFDEGGAVGDFFDQFQILGR